MKEYNFDDELKGFDPHQVIKNCIKVMEENMEKENTGKYKLTEEGISTPEGKILNNQEAITEILNILKSLKK